MDLLNGLAILGLLLSYLSPIVDPLDFWPLSFFGLTYTFWLVLNFVLLLFWVFRRKKRWIYNAFFMAIGYQFIIRTIQFNPPTKDKAEFTISAFNTKVQRVYDGGNTSIEIDNYLQDKQYDVSFLLEWLGDKGNINSYEYPYQKYLELMTGNRPLGFGIRAVSKHKILDWERIKYPHKSNNLAGFFDIDIEGKVVRFVVMHLQTNSISSSDYHTIINPDTDDEYRDYALKFVLKLKKNIEKRSIQVNTILEAIEESPYPVVIVGDFNDTPQSFAYQSLKRGRKDAFVERGNGWGATYLKPFPMLRIDYILYDPELQCTGYSSSKEISSDHKLIEAGFKFK